MSTQTAIFGGGCFWCTEAVFDRFKGVLSVVSGYSGGTVPNPTYDDVCSGNTGHAEVVKIEFDPAVIGYEQLLEIFFASHNPTTLNRQGNDVGTQYRSVILYTTPEQKRLAEAYVKKLNDDNDFGQQVVTQVVPFEQFYPAEDGHQKYFERNGGAPYCQVIINPKVTKIRQKYAELLK